MRVLMQGRIELLSGGGGDKVQIQNTAKELKKLGVDVDIKAGKNIDYTPYDVVHLFQLDWTPEPTMYAKKIKALGKPLVLSPIHHSIKEVIKFDTSYTFDFRRFAKVLFKDQFKRDTFKNIYKSFFTPQKIYPTLYSVSIGLKKIHTQALKLADKVLVQTELEAKDLEETYNVKLNWVKVLNGVGDIFTNPDSKKLVNRFNFENYILCVGRLEARKNQLSIIEAVKRLREEEKTDFQLVFVGRKSKLKHPEYIIRFERLLKKYSWIHYVPEVPYEQIPAIYKYAKVGVSASWFETTGLTSLEALFCGTNAVASGERAREYLGDSVSYCVPDNIDSIKDAIKKEYFSKRPVLSDSMLKDYTWENAARATLKVYNEVLGKL